jgi:hypothetical protein
MKASPLAGKPAEASILVDAPKLVTAYHSAMLWRESITGKWLKERSR